MAHHYRSECGLVAHQQGSRTVHRFPEDEKFARFQIHQLLCLYPDSEHCQLNRNRTMQEARLYLLS
jgi:hypothetical protein